MCHAIVTAHALDSVTQSLQLFDGNVTWIAKALLGNDSVNMLTNATIEV
jgi:hypothetical protein